MDVVDPSATSSGATRILQSLDEEDKKLLSQEVLEAIIATGRSTLRGDGNYPFGTADPRPCVLCVLVYRIHTTHLPRPRCLSLGPYISRHCYRYHSLVTVILAAQSKLHCFHAPGCTHIRENTT